MALRPSAGLVSKVSVSVDGPRRGPVPSMRSSSGSANLKRWPPLVRDIGTRWNALRNVLLNHYLRSQAVRSQAFSSGCFVTASHYVVDHRTCALPSGALRLSDLACFLLCVFDMGPAHDLLKLMQLSGSQPSSRLRKRH